ncbi:DUF2612 domain-containing protein [uncultured Anaerococcus sp.]|uniref:DUF2612 domain-containing protein n=1 Tax=uncultured Anaerococcus sp. TaxID=293428 RepID=UPI0025E49339|nr:DUF2612 domain-containing protein [uncultured Anaerococcus sp.]
MYKYEEAFNRLPERFRKPNNKKLYYVLYGYGFDKMEKVLEGVSDSRDISKATGKSLDYLGANVGELRQGQDDDRYRLLIQTKILANLSMGDIPTINYILNTLIGDKYFGLVEGFKELNEPASFLIDYDGFTNQDLDFLINRVKAAGVAYKIRRIYRQDLYTASASIAGELIIISEPSPEDIESKLEDNIKAIGISGEHITIADPFINFVEINQDLPVKSSNTGTSEVIEIKNTEEV